jgi:hypothetical protein
MLGDLWVTIIGGPFALDGDRLFSLSAKDNVHFVSAFIPQ